MAVVGYAAVSECRNVHVDRPRASTSGGQSSGGVDVGAAVVDVELEEDAAAVVAAAAAPAAAAEDAAAFFVIARQDAAEVQTRHLG